MTVIQNINNNKLSDVRAFFPDKENPAEMAIQPEMNSFINWIYERSFRKIELLIGDDASTRKSFSDQIHPVVSLQGS